MPRWAALPPAHLLPIHHPLLMKQSFPALAARCALPACVLALALLSVSCKLPSRATWSMVQQRGLFPVMMSANPEPVAPAMIAEQQTLKPDVSPEAAPIQVQAVKQPEIAKIPFATPAPGRPGYVFSPHTAGRKLVDVRNYVAGAEVRCPYTMLPFNVPDFAALAAAEPASRPRPQRSIAEVASNPAGSTLNSIPLLVPDLSPAPTSPTPEVEIPYGSRVAGRPGFVYSPFAEKNQLVDVAGIAPGVEVKCPYSNKLFRVPEPLPEEMAPAPARFVPATPPPAANPAPQPAPTPTPAPASAPAAAATPAPGPTPTANWSDRQKNLVQSPFGAAGQLVDVSGRAAGSTMQCPFTNKEFIIPAH